MSGGQILSRERLRLGAAHLGRDPLTRTAWPLVVNTGANAVLGVVYWVVAARLYDQATVGTNTALIAAMTTLSGISQLNLGPSLAVLVPRAGSGARRVLTATYGTVTVFSATALCLFFFLLLPHLNELSRVLHSTSLLVLFAVAVLTFNLFALQDAALVSLRCGKLIPLENTAFGILKIVVVAALAGVLPRLGIFASWLLPMLVVVPVVSGFVFVRTRRATGPDPGGQRTREPLRRLGLDYLGYLFQVASTFFLPVVALELLEPVTASLFSVAWLTSSTIDLLATNVGTALTVETSYGGDPRALRRTILRRAVPLVALVSGLGLVAAPLILAVYGAEYGAHAVSTLQLLLLASVPRCLVTFAIAEARAHRRMWVIVWLRAQNAAIALGLSFLLAPRFGVNGMAVAWLVAQVAGGTCALAQVWRRPVVLAREPA